jgi:HTH-type transcriptional regulator, transcriptional repressor of NAD biosynthesis genes
MPCHALVIGKFYPPHAGHHELIRAASASARRVTVVVMAASVESIPLQDRVAWLRDTHAGTNVTVTGIVDDVPVDMESDTIWRAHVELMKQALRAVTQDPVDAVLTPEAYGPELARRFGARLLPSPARLGYTSGPLVRADVAAHWTWLAPAVRAGLALRVVLVGAESTGKTTLAEQISERLRARGGAWTRVEWVGEVGRDETVAKLRAAGENASVTDIRWATPDFVRIAQAQAAAEEAAARRGGPVLVCDTDAFATGIWHERYLGKRDAAVEAAGTAAPFHLYLLTHHDDVPFVDDGVRDGEHIRAWMTDTFVQRLVGRQWHWLRGGREERLERALGMIDTTFRERRFADPLGANATANGQERELPP